MILETHGNEQAHAVAEMMENAAANKGSTQEGGQAGGFQDVRIVKDYGKIDRFVMGFKQSNGL